MKRTITIKYRWWRPDGKKVIKAHEEALEETAINLIADSINDSMTEGEINDNIHITEDDPEDGVEYKGYWTMKCSKTVSKPPKPPKISLP